MSDLTDRLRGKKANLTGRQALRDEAADRIAELEAENAALKFDEITLHDTIAECEVEIAMLKGKVIAAQKKPAGKWLPIESAPKDGSKILFNQGDAVHFGRWRSGVWEDGWYCSHGNRRHPTLWQPLPPAPKGE